MRRANARIIFILGLAGLIAVFLNATMRSSQTDEIELVQLTEGQAVTDVNGCTYRVTTLNGRYTLQYVVDLEGPESCLPAESTSQEAPDPLANVSGDPTPAKLASTQSVSSQPAAAALLRFYDGSGCHWIASARIAPASHRVKPQLVQKVCGDISEVISGKVLSSDRTPWLKVNCLEFGADENGYVGCTSGVLQAGLDVLVYED